MSEIDTNPPHVLDQIDAYLGDGLSADERIALEAHLGECAECNQVLVEARQSDDELRGLFHDTHPAPQFEDRIIQRLRAARGPRHRFVHPVVLRSAAAVAAAVLLAGTGLVVSNVLDGNGALLAGLWGESTAPRVASNLKQTGVATAMSSPPAIPRFYYQTQKPADADSPPRTWADTGAGLANTNYAAAQNIITNGTGQSGTVLRTGNVAGTANTYSQNGSQTANSNSAYQIAAGNSTITGNVVQNASGGGSNGGTLNLNGNDVQLGTTNGAQNSGVSLAGAGTITQNAAAVSNSIPPSQALSITVAGDSLAFRPTQQLEGLTKAGSGTLILTGNNNYGGGTANDWSKVSPPQAATYGSIAGTVTFNSPVSAPPGEKPLEGAAPPAAPLVAQPDNAAPPASQTVAMSGRKIIRNGTMDFEVDRFDDALVRVTSLVGEQQGFVATTDSDKLPNGKVKGTITLRVPPERLDTLVLTLRGIGDLKGQKLTAEDVTKHYTDLESELRAARAMEERLLDIVKTGKGEIKDLLEAEKELGVWREKIENIEGERRYIDSQASLSALVLTLYEKDIKLPASASETEQVNMSLETEKVDEAYAKAMEAINTAKGRIVQSELKQYDAGQFGATIVAAIPPDAAEQTIARLRQLDGRLAHFSREHRQSVQNGGTVPSNVLKVEREDAVLSMQIYNLANIAPRRTTGMKVAVNDVDQTFQQLIELVRSVGGRVVTSSLARPDANAQSGELDLQVQTEKADSVLDALHGYGEVMRQESTESPDTANVTEAKRGIRVSIVSLATTQARESQMLQVAAANVPQAFNEILNAVRAGQGRVLQSDLNEQNPQDVAGTIVFEMPRTASLPVNTAIDKSAQVLTRTVSRAANTENAVDTKLRLQISLLSAERLAPRQTTTVREEVSDVERSVDDLVNAAVTAGGRRLGSGDLTQDRAGHMTAQVIVEVPVSKAGPVLDQLERMGNRRSKQVAFDTTVPDGPLARARIDVTFSNSAASLGGEETTSDAVRNGLSVSGKGLRWSLQMLVIGFCFVAPWGAALWIIGKLIRRSRSKPEKPMVLPAA